MLVFRGREIPLEPSNFCLSWDYVPLRSEQYFWAVNLRVEMAILGRMFRALSLGFIGHSRMNNYYL